MTEDLDINDSAQQPQVGFDYALDEQHYQDTCPRCRRALVALAQSARVGGFG